MATARSASIGRSSHSPRTTLKRTGRYFRTVETIRLERDGDVLVATIDHPDSAVNAVDGVLHRELGELFRELKQESTARAVVLTGSGRAFSAGGDMEWFPSLRTVERSHALRREGKQIIWDLLDVEVPVVCGLNGAAAGSGRVDRPAVRPDRDGRGGGDRRSARQGRPRRRRRRGGDLAAARRAAGGEAAPDARRADDVGRRRSVSVSPPRSARHRRSVPVRWRGLAASPTVPRSPCRAPSRRSTPRSSRRC